MPENRQVRLAARPTGLPGPECWAVTSEEPPAPGPGEVHVEVELLSLDPAMRGWMDDVRSYVPPVGLGEVMRALGVGRVVASEDQRFAPGDHVSGLFGVQEHAVLPGDALQPVDPSVAPLPTWLGALGMTGMTAWFGLLDVGDLREGDVVVVSGAAGAVGSVAGQVARARGAGEVVGIAGGQEKCRFVVDELGFDACIDYKAGDVAAGLKEHCPRGLDLYFDNVGGDVLDACLARLRRNARVVVCGAISQYNEAAPRGPRNYLSLLVNRARMEGFVVFDFAHRYREAAQELGAMLADGRVRSVEDVVDGGVEAFPQAFLGLFEGANTGKLVLRVAG